ncbi:MAG: GNAT family N-acetyltransferase [Sarcina sp.]
MFLRKFKIEDSEVISKFIGRNFLEVNIKDYSLEEMEYMAKFYSVEKVQSIANKGHLYVAIEENEIVATGAISKINDKEAFISAVFVVPEYHGRGIGKFVMEILEKDRYFLESEIISLNASITATKFYEKLGYSYKNGVKNLNEYNVYEMIKERVYGEV